jgi:class 3 adenylate cyclase
MPDPIEDMVKACGSLSPIRRPDFLDLRHRIKKMRFRTLGDEFVQRGLEGRRQNMVLQQVFPAHIVEVLKRGDRPEIEEKTNVAVLFTDIVGFTTISSILTASQVAAMLDRLYCQLDEVITQLDLYKLEVRVQFSAMAVARTQLTCTLACYHPFTPVLLQVIGDCVIVVGNLFGDMGHCHVQRLAEFAIRALQAAARTPVLPGSDLGPVQIRCGYVESLPPPFLYP